MDILALLNAIQAVAPVNGVSIGTPSDKSTWRVDFQASATQAQRDAAANVITNFDVNAPSRDSLFAADSNRQDIISKIQNATPAQILTYVNNNVTDLASARTLLAKILLLVSRTITS